MDIFILAFMGLLIVLVWCSYVRNNIPTWKKLYDTYGFCYCLCEIAGSVCLTVVTVQVIVFIVMYLSYIYANSFSEGYAVSNDFIITISLTIALLFITKAIKAVIKWDKLHRK